MKKSNYEIRTFEDGFKVKIMPDGKRVLIYPNANGPEIVLENVDDKFINLEIESHTKEDNESRKIRYHQPISLDELEYEGEIFADTDPMNDPVRACEIRDEEERVQKFKATLTEVQLRRLEMKEENPDLSFRAIARAEGVDVKVITRCFEAIKKKFCKFFEITEPTK